MSGEAKSDIQMPKHIAEDILEMWGVCCSEAQGPENTELIKWIDVNYPDIKDSPRFEHTWLDWPK